MRPIQNYSGRCSQLASNKTLFWTHFLSSVPCSRRQQNWSLSGNSPQHRCVTVHQLFHRDALADVNKNYFKTNLPVMVFIDFKICLPTKKKFKPNGPPKQPKSLVYTIKTAYLNLNSFVQANLNLKIPISGYLNQNPT